MKKRHYIELYQHPASSLFQCIFAWLLITVYFFKVKKKNNIYKIFMQIGNALEN